MNYRTSNEVENMTDSVLELGSIIIIKSYAIRGFSAGVVFLDVQFKCVKDRNHLGVSAVIVRKGLDAKKIERFHRVIEE